MRRIALSLCLVAAAMSLAACEGPDPTPPDAPNVQPAPGGGRDGENTKEVSYDQSETAMAPASDGSDTMNLVAAGAVGYMLGSSANSQPQVVVQRRASSSYRPSSYRSSFRSSRVSRR